jgi:RimJ/RimL family protein N-acetyltransferase
VTPADGPYTQPVTLEGRHVRLEPLAPRHVPELTRAAQDDEVWRWMPWRRPRDEQAMSAIVGGLLEEQERGLRVPLATIDREGGVAVGFTNFDDLVPVHRRLEIGGTWLARDRWRTPLNTEAKLLMLAHAFDTLGVLRVSLKTDHRNERSQAAIARLGATREGVLRHHHVRPDGTLRDTVYFSILAEEWPAVRRALGERLRRG